jgi:DNA-binding response OmpR family regulator
MNVLLVDPKWTTRDFLIKKLFPQGLTLFHAENLEQATQMMHEHKMGLLIVDIDFAPEHCLPYLTALGKLPIKPMRVIISSIGAKELIMQFVSTGIAAYLIKPFTEDSGLPRIMEIINASTAHDEKRTFYRVTPDQNEERKVFFRLSSNAKLQTATLINLSAGGLALQVQDEISEEDLNTGTFIPKVQMRLSNQEIFLSGDVIYKKGPVFAMRLKNCAEHDLFILSKYIFGKIAQH